ncbi:MAG: DUF1987 domain-containing protein [Sphingobacteriia bacterium]|nr:DUF1987 domain-containing protein [Sphingobacteriia bacterium]
MEKFYLTGTDISPEISLEQNGNLILKGTSIPENSEEVYRPVLAWLRNYASHPSPITTLEVQLDYFNTSSSKFLLEILRIIKQIQDSNKTVSIKWYYYSDDPDMMESGQDFMDILELNMEMIAIPEDN